MGRRKGRDHTRAQLGGSGDERQGAEEHQRVHQALASVLARLAPAGVTANPIAEVGVERAVPVGQQLRERRAIALRMSGDEQPAEHLLRTVLDPAEQDVGVGDVGTEGGGQLGADEPVPEVQLEDLAIARVETPCGVPHQLHQLGSGRHFVGFGRLVEHVTPVGVDVVPTLLPKPHERLVPCDGIEPWSEGQRVSQLLEPLHRPQEGVLGDVSSVVAVAQDAEAVAEDAVGVAVVQLGEGGAIARDRRRHLLGIVGVQRQCRSCSPDEPGPLGGWMQERPCPYITGGDFSEERCRAPDWHPAPNPCRQPVKVGSFTTGSGGSATPSSSWWMTFTSAFTSPSGRQRTSRSIVSLGPENTIDIV
jgi:hypothetical protein